VRQKCAKCSKEFCLACGEAFSNSKTQSERDVDDLDLFHCPNLQGVVLGVGLAMLEQVYHDQTQNPSAADADSRGNKRRQPEPVHNSSTPDDDDDSYPPLPVQKKKIKVGTGYAGDVREDVSLSIFDSC
jgi:hypothetical protein